MLTVRTPENYAGYTQGRTWSEAAEMAARYCIAGLLDVAEDSFDVRLLAERAQAEALRGSDHSARLPQLAPKRAAA